MICHERPSDSESCDKRSPATGSETRSPFSRSIVSNLKSPAIINSLCRHPSDDTSASRAARPLRGIPCHRGKYFVHRHSWTELVNLPFYTYDEFTQKFGQEAAIEDLLNYFRYPTNVPDYDIVQRIAAKFGYEFFPKDLERRKIYFAKRRLFTFPLATPDQAESGINAIVIKFGRLDDQGPEWTDFFLVHYLDDVWSVPGNQPSTYDVFDDDDDQITYGSRRNKVVRPLDESGYLWDVIEFHEDSQRRWILGFCVDSASVGTLISMREARQSRGSLEVRLKRELGQLVEPSRAKHRDVDQRMDYPARVISVSQDPRMKTPLDLLRRKDGDYERAGVEFIDGVAIDMIWVVGMDGVRERVKVPKSRKNIPLTLFEQTHKSKYGFTDTMIQDCRQRPEMLEVYKQQFFDNENARNAEGRSSEKVPDELLHRDIKPNDPNMKDEDYPSTEV